MAAIYSTSIMNNYISDIKKDGSIAGYSALGGGLGTLLLGFFPVTGIIGGLLGAVICGYYKSRKDKIRDTLVNNYIDHSGDGDKLILSKTLGFGLPNFPIEYSLTADTKNYIKNNNKWGKIEIEAKTETINEKDTKKYYFAGTQNEFAFIKDDIKNYNTFYTKPESNGQGNQSIMEKLSAWLNSVKNKKKAETESKEVSSD
jgi:hypothetical protein